MFPEFSKPMVCADAYPADVRVTPEVGRNLDSMFQLQKEAFRFSKKNHNLEACTRTLRCPGMCSCAAVSVKLLEMLRWVADTVSIVCAPHLHGCNFFLCSLFLATAIILFSCHPCFAATPVHHVMYHALEAAKNHILKHYGQYHAVDIEEGAATSSDCR